jgi:hypothetical protein
MSMLHEMPRLAPLFGPGLHPLEAVLRGSAMYWFLFPLFRFVLRRDAGALSVSTLAGWSWLTDRGAYRWNLVRRFAEPPPMVLVRGPDRTHHGGGPHRHPQAEPAETAGQ